VPGRDPQPQGDVRSRAPTSGQPAAVSAQRPRNARQGAGNRRPSSAHAWRFAPRGRR